MNENLPVNVASSVGDVGTISYANEVIAIIAGMATAEVDGVAGMTGASSIAEFLGRSKSVTKGVRVEVGSEEASVDLTLVVEYGKPIQKVCNDVQEGVRKSIETMTGLHVVRVDVHVQGVSFEKETKELQQGSQKAKIDEMLAQETRPVKVEAPSKMETPMPAKADEEIDVEIPEMEEDEAEDVTEEAALDVEEMQKEPEDASTDTQEKLEDPESETLPEKDASR